MTNKKNDVTAIDVKNEAEGDAPREPAYSLALDEQWLINTLYVESSRTDDERMQNYVLTQLRDMGLEVSKDNFGNTYATKGADVKPADMPFPCVIAHTDTVHKILPEGHFRIFQDNGVLFGMDMHRVRAAGIGGDDKVGVYIALELVKQLPYCKVAFFRFEETGCRGSGVAYMPFFDDVSMVLQADRRNFNDFIDYSNGCKIFSEEFHDAVKPLLESYGYKRTGGLGTDVGQLKQRGLSVCCVNLSCGYYNPHEDYEYVIMEDVETALNLMYDLFTQFGDRVWPHTLPPKPVVVTPPPTQGGAGGQNNAGYGANGKPNGSDNGWRDGQWQGRTGISSNLPIYGIYDENGMDYDMQRLDYFRRPKSIKGRLAPDTDLEAKETLFDDVCVECGAREDELHYHDFGYYCTRCEGFFYYSGFAYDEADYKKYPAMALLFKQYSGHDYVPESEVIEGEYRDIDDRRPAPVSLLMDAANAAMM